MSKYLLPRKDVLPRPRLEFVRDTPEQQRALMPPPRLEFVKKDEKRDLLPPSRHKAQEKRDLMPPSSNTVNKAPPRLARWTDDDADDDEESDDDESASDSLVNIRAAARAAQEREAARAAVGRGTDQVSRFAVAHERATAAAAAATEEEASETTVEREADRARSAALPAIASSSTRAVAPRSRSAPAEGAAAPLDAGHVNDVFASPTTGVAPPLSMRENYTLLQRQINDALRSGRAPTSGQGGSRIADVASRLVREAPDLIRGVSGMRVLASTASPLENAFVQQLVTEYVAEASLPPHANDPQNEAVERMRQAIRPSHRRHEEAMLRPPRPGEPACIRGADCKGNAIICEDGGETLVAYYYEDEWAKYQYDVRNGVPDARLPDQARMCLLCLRYDTHRFIHAVRTQNTQFLLNNSLEHPDTPPVLVQPHFNLTNVPGEYRLQDCNTPVSPVFEGILYPMVKPSLTAFVRAIDPATHGIVFRQLFPYPSNDQSAAPQAPKSKGF